MNFIKNFLKLFSLLPFYLLLLLNFNSFVFADEFDDFDIFSDDNLMMASFLENNEPSMAKERPTPDEILTLLVKTMQADKLLQEDIFLRTNVLAKRSLLDNSIFLMDKNYDSGRFVFSTDIFFEQTWRMHFTSPCKAEDNRQTNQTASCLKSYLALTSPTLLCKVKDLEDKARVLGFGVDCLKGLSLIKNATAQERSAGLFFGLEWQTKNLNFRLKAPFYYKERNLYLSCAEQDALAKEFGGPCSDEEKAKAAQQGFDFARKHLISDQLGLGDLRFEFDTPIAEGKRDLEVRWGLFTTIPTAVAVVKGLLGEVFEPVTCRPTLDLVTLVDQFQAEVTRQEALDKVSDLALSAIDNISAMLLDSSLGNNGHFGLGTKFRNDLPMRSVWDKPCFENLRLKGILSVEYLLPHRETRWFVEKNDPSLFTMRDFADDSMAAENLAFLESMIVNRVFPFAYKSQVSPGFIFIWAEKLAFEKKKWGAHLGTDVWMQSKEKIDGICAPAGQIPLLDIEKARKPFACQWSLFGSVFFKPKKKVGDLYIGLNAEKVVYSRGIGQPFKLSLSLERNF